jgi:hypothetical protein
VRDAAAILRGTPRGSFGETRERVCVEVFGYDTADTHVLPVTSFQRDLKNPGFIYSVTGPKASVEGLTNGHVYTRSEGWSS